MSCTDCESNEIKYAGDGQSVLFTFPFTYIDETDVRVSLWNEDVKRWEDLPPWYDPNVQPEIIAPRYWRFDNATTIRFLQIREQDLGQFDPIPPAVDWAPPVPTDTTQTYNIRISRCTAIDPLAATFYPGSAIRAKDLNDNFDQLKFAIQEGRCQVPDWLFDYLDDYYFDKLGDAITREEQINDPNTPVVQVDDKHVFTASASAARHDAYISDAQPAAVPVEQPGKIWNDTDDTVDYFWDPSGPAWVSFTKSGPAGPQGDFGPPGRVIISDNPPMRYPAVGDNESRELESGDLWWDSNRVLLYVYYVDQNGPGQWVAVSKTGPQGPQGEQGVAGNAYTFINPLALDANTSTVTFEIDNLSTI
jgi:hypothetical protein